MSRLRMLIVVLFPLIIIAVCSHMAHASRDELPAGAPLSVPTSDLAPIIMPLKTLKGHEKSVSCMAFTSDGRTLATGGDDRRVVIWDVSSGRKLHEVSGFKENITAIAFSPDQRTLAVVTKKEVALVETATWSRKGLATGHEKDVLSLGFNPRLPKFATGGEDKTVFLRDGQTGTVLMTLKGHTDDVLAVAFSPDGKMLASGGKDRNIILWKVSDGTTIRTLAGDSRRKILSLAFSPDGKILAAGSDDKSIDLWNPSSGKQILSIPVKREAGSFVFTPDGRIVVAAGREKAFFLLEVATGNELLAFRTVPDDILALARNPDGSLLASAVKDGSVIIWDLPAISRYASDETRKGYPYSTTLTLKSYDKEREGFEIELWNQNIFVPVPKDRAATLGKKKSEGEKAFLDSVKEFLSARRHKIEARVEGILKYADPERAELLNTFLVDVATGQRFPFGAQAQGLATASLPSRRFSGGEGAAANVPPRLEITTITLVEPSGNNMLDAGESATIKVTIKNSGKGGAEGVSLDLDPPQGKALPAELRFNQKNYIGSIGPGESVTQEIAVLATEELKAGSVSLSAVATEMNGFDSGPFLLAFKTKEYAAPLLTVTKMEIRDPDGKRVISKGKEATVTLNIRNEGAGAARGVRVILESSSEAVRLFSEGEIELGVLAPGEVKKAEYTLAVTQRYQGDKILPVRFFVREERERYSLKPDIRLALNEEAPELRTVTIEEKVTPAPRITAEENIDYLPPLDKGRKMIGPEDTAVVIGIERYQNVLRSEFSYNDAKAVKAYLLSLGFAERNIEYLTDERATRAGIKKTLESWLPNRVKKGSRVVVYFSGHGAPEPATGDSYLVPFDGDPNYLVDTGYPLKSMYDKLGALPASEVTVVIDACFSGAGGRSVLAKGARPLVMITEGLALPSNVVVLSSTKGSQISTFFPEKDHGLFTYYFLQALRLGKGSVVEILDYVKPQVEDEAKRQNVTQTPSLTPDPEQLKGRFLLRK